jgi:hypothetical protein
VASNVAGGTYENLAVAKTDTQRVEAKAPILVRIPRVLGETIPETGAGTSDYLLFISSLLMIVAGTIFITEGRRVSRNEK